MDVQHLKIGYVDWIKGSEYGMVYDLESHSKFFFHLSKNPLIIDLKKDFYVIFEIFYDKRKKQECAKHILEIALIEDKYLLKSLINKFGDPVDKSDRIGLEKLYSGYKSSDIEKLISLLQNQIKKIDFCSDENLSKLKDNKELIEEYLNSENFKLLKPNKIVEYFHDYIQENILILVKKKSPHLTYFSDDNGDKLFDKIIYELESIDSEESFRFALELIRDSLIIGSKTSEKLTQHFVKVASSLYKVKFWLKDKNKVDFISSLKEIFMSVDGGLLCEINQKLSLNGRNEEVRKLGSLDIRE